MSEVIPRNWSEGKTEERSLRCFGGFKPFSILHQCIESFQRSLSIVQTVTMDIVLELADYLFFDRLYATLLPKTRFEPSPPRPAGTTTFSSRREVPTLHPSSYQPASQFLNLGFSSFANRSDWPRDFVGRQAISLFLITWCALPFAACKRDVSELTPTRAVYSASSCTLSSPPSPTCSSSISRPSRTPNTSRIRCARRSSRRSPRFPAWPS